MLSSQIKEKFLSFVFQPECFICGVAVRPVNGMASADSATVCGRCREAATEPLAERCLLCSSILNQPSPFGNRCARCRDWKPKFDRVLSIGNYRGGLRSTIVEIKRDFHDTKAFQLGLLLGEQFQLRHGLTQWDAVVPVPSHWRRKWSRRGFQPSSVLADGFCRSTGISKLSNTLYCGKFVQKQSKMVPHQRMGNVRKSFAVRPRSNLQDMRILLIDDVMTSGSTANECARIIRAAGAVLVEVAVAARGLGR